MKTRGRKVTNYPSEEIMKIIINFSMENSLDVIKYKAIFEFAKTQYNQGKCAFILSEDFWRKPNRQGRISVDDWNQKRTYTNIRSSDHDHVEVVSTEITINNLSRDTSAAKKKMISILKVNEVSYQNLSKKYKRLKEHEKNLRNEVDQQKSYIKNLLEKNAIYEQVLFQWADISSDKEINLVNVNTTGKTRSHVVDNLFQDMFSKEPNLAFKQINVEPSVSNVIEIKNTKRNTIVEDLDL